MVPIMVNRSVFPERRCQLMEHDDNLVILDYELVHIIGPSGEL